MAIKELQTRIQLKHDSYSAWTTAPGKDLVLLAGEIAVCEIPSTNNDSNVAPTVLFKVGNGTSTFESLPWASAKAADVYSWAKASDVQLDGKTIKFIGTDKTITLNYVTESEVKAITDPLAGRVAALEGKFGETGDVAAQLADHESRLDTIEGEGAGSIKKAAADAQAAAEAAAATDATAKANAAEAAAKEHATGLNTAMNTRVEDLESAKAASDNRITANENAIKALQDTTIPGVISDYEDADKAINDKIGTGFDETNTVAKAVEEAKAAGTTAQQQVTDLTNGAVATNASNISKNAGDIAQLREDLTDEIGAREDADDALNTRLEKVEAFFEVAEGEQLNTALDTLKEIQDYLTGDGDAANDLITRVAAAEQDIDDLEKEFAAGGRVAQAEAGITAVGNRATTLENIVKGYTDEGSVKTAVDAAQEAANNAAAAASTADGKAVAAQEAAENAQKEVDALEVVVDGVKTTAENAQAQVAAVEPRVEQAETDIDALEAIVKTGADANATLRSDITALQQLTGGDNGNAKLREDLTAVQNTVNDATTGLAATKAVADKNKTDIGTLNAKVATIESDYLKAEDLFIINCGTASTVNHTA